MIRKIDIEVFLGSAVTWAMVGAKYVLVYVLAPLLAVVFSRIGGWLYENHVEKFLNSIVWKRKKKY